MVTLRTVIRMGWVVVVSVVLGKTPDFCPGGVGGYGDDRGFT